MIRIFFLALLVSSQVNAFERTYGRTDDSAYAKMADSWYFTDEGSGLINNNNTIQDAQRFMSPQSDKEFTYIEFRKYGDKLSGMIRVIEPDIPDCAYNEMIGTVNGQRMVFSCSVNKWGIKNIFPTSVKANQFFTNQFIAKHRVQVKLDNYHFIFTANGFSKKSKQLKDSTAI